MVDWGVVGCGRVVCGVVGCGVVWWGHSVLIGLGWMFRWGDVMF